MPPNENPNDHMKMYVIINRRQLSLVQCGVQAGHAIAEFAHLFSDLPSYKEWVNNHKTMIFLEANRAQANDLINMANDKCIKSRCFKEPDLGDIWTATAFEPISSTDGKNMFGHLRLLR